MQKLTQVNPDDQPTAASNGGVGARAQLSVGFVLLDQFTLAAFSGFIDVLRLAGDLGGGSRQIHTMWQVMSVDGLPRTSSAGIALEVSGGLAQDPQAFDYIAICGGNDYLNTHMPSHLRDWLQRVAKSRTRLLGICTGTFSWRRPAWWAVVRCVCTGTCWMRFVHGFPRPPQPSITCSSTRAT